MNIGTGVINWPRNNEMGWTDTREGGTFVYAYWLADHSPRGLDLIDGKNWSEDWFVRHPWAEDVIETVYAGGGTGLSASPNVSYLDDARVLAAVCLGTNDGAFYHPTRDGYWWASEGDLSRHGAKVVRELSRLYQRQPLIVTYLGVVPMNVSVPEAAHDPATVVAVSGHS